MTTTLTNAHIMAAWPTVDRGDGRVEIICPHGVGHPVESLSKSWDSKWMGVHGCDGCCGKAIFRIAEETHLRWQNSNAKV